MITFVSTARREFHAFWEDLYGQQTKFVSDPTTQSSILGVDFYKLGLQGKEYGPYGELFPLSDPAGSGLMRCVEGEVQIFSNYVEILRYGTESSDDATATIFLEYEIKRGVEYEEEISAIDCVSPPTGIVLDVTATRTPKWPVYDMLRLEYTLDKSQLTNATNIWDADSGKLLFCHTIRLVSPPLDRPGGESNGTNILLEESVKVGLVI